MIEFSRWLATTLLAAIMLRMSLSTAAGARTLAAMNRAHSESIRPSLMIFTGGKRSPSW